MEKILFVGHSEEDGSLARPGLEALKTAKELSESLLESRFDVGLVGSRTDRSVEQVSGTSPDKLFTVTGEDFSQARYATDAAAVEAICLESEPTIVLAAGTSRLNRIMPGVATRLGGRADTHICDVAVEGESIQLTRWYYRQRMQAILSRAQRPWVIVVDPGTQRPWEAPPNPIEPTPVTVELSDSHTRSKVTGVEEPEVGEQTIRPDADLLFVAGAGWTKVQSDGQAHAGQAEELIIDFLRKSKASLGGSKSMVELGGEGQAVLSFMTHLNQIGQTGATPRHPKGLATCCHGEEPHVVGWRFVTERRAVNLDPNCGWAHGKADVLYVEDAFAVMARVNQLLGQE
jgi:electron transfer flavoprotein alpha subunit